MKKFLLGFLCCLVSVICINVYALCELGDNLCNLNEEGAELFTICQSNSDCKTIDTNNINENGDFGFFEIRDREIYLNNSQILILDFRNIWSELNYKIHITGNNKITRLQNINLVKYNNRDFTISYPELYTNDYIPFSVVGDGTLEIETAEQIMKDSAGDNYYNYWSLKYYTGRTSCEANIVGQLASECDWNNETCANYTLSKTEIREKFIESENSLAVRDDGRLQTLTNYSSTSGIGMENPSDREAFIYNLLDGLHIKCGFYLLKPELSSVAIEKYAQLTRDLGEEFITTDLNRSFTETGSYLLSPKQTEPTGNLEEVTTTQAGNIIFTSSEAFDSNYHLSVEDITESITDVDASKVEAKTDKVLIKLYDINMLDKDNKVVDMGNGTYTIKVALSDLLKKYNEYQIVYIGESSVELIPVRVEENYIVFNTTHLSKYGIVGLEKTTKRIIDTSNTEVKNPKTADNMIYYGIVFATLVVASIFTIVRIRTIEASD